VAKKNVVEIVCERCERTEYRQPDECTSLPDLYLNFGTKQESELKGQDQNGTTVTVVREPEPDVAIKYDDLCSSCMKTVKNLVAQIGRKINWKREGKGEIEVPVEQTDS
jgi:hypothetical protein